MLLLYKNTTMQIAVVVIVVMIIISLIAGLLVGRWYYRPDNEVIFVSPSNAQDRRLEIL